ncbi:MAG: hypothetical protein E7195_06635 [Peptococcaceae bacterium]|nr:hypothetical protein [Peptococcaceae bacterium]
MCMTEHANRNYRESVFTKYFREHPEGLIELYNAIADTDYPLDTPVEPDSLDDVLYKERINDLSFVLDNQILVLVEHQSTMNENMALRLLMYVARLYEKLLNKWNKRAMYEEKRIPIPKPKFVVLYNGSAACPKHTVQYLSSSFMMQDEEPVLELKVDVYNINYEEHSELLQKSKHLTDYSLFIHLVNEGRVAGKALEEAIREAIRYCIEHDIMSEFLRENGSEVHNMLLGEWKLEEAMEYKEQKGREEGERIGEVKKQHEMIRKFSQINTPEQIAETLQLSLEYVLAVLSGASVVSEPEVPYNAKKKE